MLSFTFDNKNSYADYGIVIKERPNLPTPKRRVDYIEIPGSDSTYWHDEGTYEDITIVVECNLKYIEGNIYDRLDEIIQWLYEAGEADLFFSFQPNKVYSGQVVNSIDIRTVHKIVATFPIIFTCRPYRYEGGGNGD